jgi:tubulin beta
VGTEFCEVVCDEHGIGSSGEKRGGIDAHLGRINVLYREALGGTYLPLAVLFDIKLGVIGAETLSRRSANSSAREAS